MRTYGVKIQDLGVQNLQEQLSTKNIWDHKLLKAGRAILERQCSMFSPPAYSLPQAAAVHHYEKHHLRWMDL